MGNKRGSCLGSRWAILLFQDTLILTGAAVGLRLEGAGVL